MAKEYRRRGRTGAGRKGQPWWPKRGGAMARNRDGGGAGFGWR
jgi:hypothetical protein